MGYQNRNYTDTKTYVGEFVCRVTEGLPLRAVPLMTALLLGILSRAQEKYNVEIAHFVFMENHYHIIIFGETKNIDKFFNMLNSLTARLIKFLTGAYPYGKVWSRRYNSMQILTAKDVIDRIIYIYMNPVRAKLVNRIADWKGACSYNWFYSGTKELLFKFVPLRVCFKKLTAADFEKSDADQLQQFENLDGEIHRFKLNPFGWKKFFADYADKSDDEIWKEIRSRLDELEAQYNKQFEGKFKGMKKVKQRPLVVDYVPEPHKPAPFLVCSDTLLRIQKILEHKNLCNQCREAYKKLKCGINARYPKGMFRPSIPLIGRSQFVAA